MSFRTLFLFIPFLKILTADSDSKTIARVEKILTQNKIPYRIQSVSTRGTVGRTFDAMSFKSLNVGQGRIGYSLTMNYVVYVRKKDFELASQLISQ